MSFFVSLLVLAWAAGGQQEKHSMPLPKAPGLKGYSADFFRSHNQLVDLYPSLAAIIIKVLQVPLEEFSVVDVGCGHGYLVRVCRDSNVQHFICFLH